ncbi:MAG: hypothetical protein IVW53_12100 [Chloroflexi bacterium]|nr:hypothetical protein [Chloroflexota bacterium]
MAPRSGFGSTAFVVLAYGVAMGYLEAAVVVYLRAAIGLTPAGMVPIHDPTAFRAFADVEVAREFATLVMIAAVGWLAGRRGLERLAWAAVVFGVWDIVYYLGLRLLIGWPPSPAAWDVLFLSPMPWLAPVWAPFVVSSALVGFGLAGAHRLRTGRPIAVGRGRLLAALAGGGLVILSFLVDSNRVLSGDTSGWTGWPLFWSGMVLAALTTATALARPPRATPPGGGPLGNGTGGRPAARAPD